MLKESANIKASRTVNLDMFEKYFKAINNPDDPFFRPDEDVLYFNERYLLSCVGKLFTRVLNNRLYEWGDTYNVL